MIVFNQGMLLLGSLNHFLIIFTAGNSVQLKFEGLNTYFFEVQTLI